MVAAVTMPHTPPGWYPDPNHPGRQIYWDGARWAQPVPAPSNGRSAAVAIGVLLLVVIGLVMSMQPVTMMTGSTLTWMGVGVAAAGTASAFLLRAAVWARVVACVVLAIALINAVYIESQLSDRRAEFSQIFDD